MLDQTWEFALADHFDEALERACVREPGIKTFWAPLVGDDDSAADAALELLGLAPDELLGCLERRFPAPSERPHVAAALLIPLEELVKLNPAIREDAQRVEQVILPWLALAQTRQ